MVSVGDFYLKFDFDVYCSMDNSFIVAQKKTHSGYRRRRNRMDRFNQGLNKGGGQVTYTIQHTGCCKGCAGCGSNANNGNGLNGKTKRSATTKLL